MRWYSSNFITYIDSHNALGALFARQLFCAERIRATCLVSRTTDAPTSSLSLLSPLCFDRTPSGDRSIVGSTVPPLAH